MIFLSWSFDKPPHSGDEISQNDPITFAPDLMHFEFGAKLEKKTVCKELKQKKTFPGVGRMQAHIVARSSCSQ